MNKMPKKSEDTKQIPVRIPLPLWKACHHRMVDDMVGWQELIIGMLEKYAAEDPANDENPSLAGGGFPGRAVIWQAYMRCFRNHIS